MLKSMIWGLGLSLTLLACQAQQAFVPLHPVSLQAQASTRSQGQSTLSGNFKFHRQVASQHLEHKRDVLVYLPPGYAQNPQQRYPVLYMHDGNNIFDRSTSFGGAEWQVDEHAQRLIQSGQMEPVIIVGVYNTAARLDEYTWYPMDWDGQMRGGAGQKYAQFLVRELKPLIDTTYRTLPDREHTAVMGSSLGGLISFYLGLHYPQVFSKIGMMSPSVWWKDKAILNDVPKLSRNLKVWVDIGTREGRDPEAMLQNTKDFTQALEQQGFEHFKNLAFHIEPNAGHNEAAWAARMQRPLTFFYGK